jgi:hypothetical protein
MNKLAIKLKNLSSPKALKKNISLVFVVMLFCLFIYEAYVIKNCVYDVFFNRPEVAKPASNKSVRINFADYNAIVERIQNAKSFKVTDWAQNNPFGIK